MTEKFYTVPRPENTAKRGTGREYMSRRTSDQYHGSRNTCFSGAATVAGGGKALTQGGQGRTSPPRRVEGDKETLTGTEEPCMFRERRWRRLDRRNEIWEDQGGQLLTPALGRQNVLPSTG